MSELIKQIGKRIRNYRIEQGLSQEHLAELSHCHPTYIGQIERGEKNATIESIEKIASALHVSLSTLFEGLSENPTSENTLLIECYNLLANKNHAEQKALLEMLHKISDYKNS